MRPIPLLALRASIQPNRAGKCSATFFLAAIPRPGYNCDMTIDIDATYRDGAIYPRTPLNLPENTPARVRDHNLEIG